jgi:hypothetical protein
MTKMTEDEIQNWNELFPLKSPCLLRLDDGSEIETRVRSEAWALHDGTVVVKLEGKAGGWDIDRVKRLRAMVQLEREDA